ncbi:MAG: serine hydrolase [Flavobacteriales bacterium]|nr:serine hydrolase [Flavobacteriales bacterium]
MRLPIASTALLAITTYCHAQVGSPERTTAMDKAMAEHFTADAPGGAAIVAQGGKVLFESALGSADVSAQKPLTTANQFRIGSVSKQFAAVSILQLAEAGKLKLDDEIQRYVDFPKKEQPITVQHLLTHTSGIPNFTNGAAYSPDAYAKDIALKDLIARFADQPLEFAPGTKWSYSNSGYILLSAIIERVSGRSWSDYAEEHLFKPVGMTQSSASISGGALLNEAVGYAEDSTGWKPANPVSMSWPLAAGNIRSTVGDLLKWNTSVFAGKLVSDEWLAKAHTSVVLADGTTHPYGFGWGFKNIQGSPTIEHSGGIDGFVSNCIYLPQEDLYIAVLVNRESDDASALAAELAAIAMGKPYGGEEVALSPAEAQALTGVYVNAEGVERYITAEGNKLVSTRQGSSPKPLRHLGNDRFLYEGDVITLNFQRTDGKVTGARFLARDRDEHLIRSDKPLPKPRVEVPLKNADLQAYAGEFELMPGFTLTFRAEGDHLFVLPTRQGEIEVFGEAPHKFFLKVVDATIEFHPEEDGSVKRLTFNQGGVMEGKRIR